jgi:hypothetical protein
MYILERFYFSMSCHVDSPQTLMSLTDGYNLRDGDKNFETPTQITEIMSPLVIPRGALVNHLRLCEIPGFILFV